jgi:hypothetical protein
VGTWSNEVNDVADVFEVFVFVFAAATAGDEW